MTTEMSPQPYNDSILTISDRGCPDPYVLLDKGTYYMTYTCGGHIELWSADSLFDMEKRCRKEVIWRPPPGQPYSADLWAPELHALNGRWWLYFAANHPNTGNRSHRMYVLAGPDANEDPMDPGKWNFYGNVVGMPDDQWAIDGTVITLHGTLYFVYSGWPFGVTHDESRQEIFIIEMVSPTECKGKPVCISFPDLPYEFSGAKGVNEGPQFLCSPDGKWMGIVYSCAGSWTSEYKMNVLYYSGDNPLDMKSWCKSNHPLLQSSKDDTPPYAPGHGNFVLVDTPCGPEVWGVFHATDEKTGWEGRKARIMRVGWGGGGPFMGNGECGRCCGHVEHFLQGCPGGDCGGKGHCGGEGGPGWKFLPPGVQGNGSSNDIKRTANDLAKEGKKFFKQVFK